MTAAFIAVCVVILAAAAMLTVTQVRRDLRRTGSVRGLYAEWKRIVFTPAPAQEIPGWPGWTRKQIADPHYGVDPVTGRPRYTGAKTGPGEWYVRDNGLPAAMRDAEGREAS